MMIVMDVMIVMVVMVMMKCDDYFGYHRCHCQDHDNIMKYDDVGDDNQR